MATGEKRTLSIKAVLVDAVTRPLSAVERSLLAFGRTGAVAVKGLVGVLTSAKTAIVGLATAWLGYRGIEAVRSISEQVDALGKLAATSGDSIENLSELQAAFELGGVAATEFAGVLKALAKAQAAGLDRSTDQAQAFEDLGVSLRDLETLSPSELFERIAAGLEGFNGEQAKAVALSKLLPKQWQELAPTIGRGLASFQATIAQVRAAGATVTQEQADAAASLNDSLSLLQISIASVGRELLVAFGPQATEFFTRLSAVIQQNRAVIVDAAVVIGKGIATGFEFAVDVLLKLVGLLEKVAGPIAVDTTELDQKIGAARAELAKFREEQKRVEAENPFAPLLPDVRRLQQEIAHLEAVRSGGLRARLQELRDEFKTSLSGLTVDAPPVTGDKAAAAVGLPTPKVVDQLKAELQRAIAENPVEVPSVFRQRPQAGTGLGLEDQDATQRIAKEQEAQAARLQALRNVAQMSSELKPVRLELIEIDRAAALLDLREATRKGVLNLAEYKKAVDDVNAAFDKLKAKEQGGFGVGFARGLQNLKQQVQDFATTAGTAFANLAENSLDNFANGIADVVTGAKSAKEAFRDFARQFLVDIARMTAKLLILGTIKNIFGLETGGVVGGDPSSNGTVPVQKFAKGGIARRPTLAVFGEGRNAEAFVPLPDNRSIPVTMQGGGGGNSVVLNITAWDSKDVTRTLLEQRSLLNGITQNGMERLSGMRQVVRRTSA